jgi:16S rRNA (cytidine1402-2'-O)-methyltransferase
VNWARFEVQTVTGTLFLVPNLLGVAAAEDVLPVRTMATARRLSHFVVETPKIARAFLKALSPDRVIADIAMIACDPAAAAIDQCAAWLKSGIDVGVISDAGCPGMADPGAVFVSLAHRIDATVVPLVGPSSLLLGLMASGFDGQHFTFHGYLPSKPPERDKALKLLEKVVRETGATQIFIETPYRNAALIAAIKATINGEVALCLAQNLASENEQVCSKLLAKWSTADLGRFESRSPALFLLGQISRS